MSSTKQYTPTATARPTWREREAIKERQQREAATRAADEQQRRSYANTEDNFPTTMKATKSKGKAGSKFAELATKWQVEEEIERQLERYRRANSERERDTIRDAVVFLRTRRLDEIQDDLSTIPDEEMEEPSEEFPTHGKRGTNTEPDSEGWRTIVKRNRKQKRTLTEAELAEKYRKEFFGREEDEYDDYDDYDAREYGRPRSTF